MSIKAIKVGMDTQWYEAGPAGLGLAADRWVALCSYHIMKRISARDHKHHNGKSVISLANLKLQLKNTPYEQFVPWMATTGLEHIGHGTWRYTLGKVPEKQIRCV